MDSIDHMLADPLDSKEGNNSSNITEDLIFLLCAAPSSLFRDGYFNPEVVKYRQLCAKSQKRRRLYFLQQYYHKLLKRFLSLERYYFSTTTKINQSITQIKRHICCFRRSFWIMPFTMARTVHQNEKLRVKIMLKCVSRGLEEDSTAY
uniref:Uncharacterized protein n=1 Tax=Neogobius melanostomus TaxID=47308 RepID=A0A8C6SXP9_9GOBI